MKLIIVRHGRTVKNAAGIVQGQGSGQLSDLGKKQAEAVGKSLKNIHFDYAYCSDLQRAVDTAAAVMKHQQCPIEYHSEIREKAFGIFEGRTYKEYLKVCEESGDLRSEFTPDGGESFVDMLQRVQKFWDSIVQKHSGQTIMICSHGGTIRCFLAALGVKELEDTISFNIDNTSLCTFELNESGSVTNYDINNTDHLKELEAGKDINF